MISGLSNLSFQAMYHASSSADENISMNMGLGGQDGCGGNGMFNDASSTEADGKTLRLYKNPYFGMVQENNYQSILIHFT